MVRTRVIPRYRRSRVSWAPHMKSLISHPKHDFEQNLVRATRPTIYALVVKTISWSNYHGREFLTWGGQPTTNLWAQKCKPYRSMTHLFVHICLVYLLIRDHFLVFICLKICRQIICSRSRDTWCTADAIRYNDCLLYTSPSPRD